MIKKVLKIISLLALLALAVPIVSHALFVSQAVTPGNSVKAGTIYLGKDKQNKGVLDKCISLSKLLPGAPAEKEVLTVKNVGDLPAYLNGIAANIKDSPDKFLANAVQVTCTGSGGEKLYSGSLLSLDGNAVPTEKQIPIAPGKAIELSFCVQLDPRAGNWYAGRQIEFTFTVYAGQESGRPLETTAVIAGGDVQQAIDNAATKSIVLIPAGKYGQLRVPRSGMTIKAKDVVYDTVVSRFAIGGAVSEPENVAIAGFTLDGRGGAQAVIDLPPVPRSISITDNILINSRSTGQYLFHSGIISQSDHLILTRNNFSGLNNDPADTTLSNNAPVKFKPVSISPGKNCVVKDNLGIDRDPAVDAL